MSVPAQLPAAAPARTAPAPSGSAATQLADARRLTRRNATTFSLACRLLPREVREDVYLLYAVFRRLDDLVDQRHPAAEARVAAVADWAAGASGAPGAPLDEVRLLDRIATRRPIDRPALADFCAGMRHDLSQRGFGTEADVDRYCYQVAGTVGVVMGGLLGAGDGAAARDAAAALGMAMQRTNILRDLDEDAAAGRDYVSAEARARYGAPLPGRRRAFVAAQIAHADELYERGLAGVDHLRMGRTAIIAAAQMYREILRELERRDGGELPGRAVVSLPRKLRVGLAAVGRRRRRGGLRR